MEQITEIRKIPVRDRNSHKGDFGRVLILAGSQGMVGAACLATEACLRTGAGLVTLGIPKSLLPIVQAKLTCAMTKGFSETFEQTFHENALDEILSFAQKIDVIALGPGISQHPSTQKLVHQLMLHWNKPLVLDADALNNLVSHADLLQQRTGITIITPHPGEFGRLTQKTSSEILENKIDLAGEFSRGHRCIVVLKFARTIVTDGAHFFINTTGNPGMATGGSGDVLTGVIAGLLAQNFSAWEAASIGVWAHGCAGDLAANEIGEMGLIASDLIPQLPKVWKTLQQVFYNKTAK